VPAVTHTPRFLACFSATVRQPQDDSLRSDLANWLDENGDPLWAELIRSQLTLAQAARPLHEATPLTLRTQELLDRVGHRIRAFGRELTRGLELSHVDIAGGLPGHVFAAPDVLFRSAADIAAALPVTAVNLTAWPAKCGRPHNPFPHGLFGSVTELAISPVFDSNDRHATASVLGRIGRLADLRRLTLSGAAITDSCVRHLTGLPALRSLDLSANRLTDGSMRDLGRLTRVTSLDLSYNPITDVGVESLLRFPTLEWVNLRGTGITSACGQLLVRLPSLKRVFVGDSAVLASLGRSLGNRVSL
jgi:uncharacterized protein (TIGR02996 family)